MNTWQPIETAPLDGTRVLGCDAEVGTMTVVYAYAHEADGVRWWSDVYDAWNITVTHWMPLPTPPNKEGPASS